MCWTPNDTEQLQFQSSCDQTVSHKSVWWKCQLPVSCAHTIHSQWQQWCSSVTLVTGTRSAHCDLLEQVYITVSQWQWEWRSELGINVSVKSHTASSAHLAFVMCLKSTVLVVFTTLMKVEHTYIIIYIHLHILLSATHDFNFKQFNNFKRTYTVYVTNHTSV